MTLLRVFFSPLRLFFSSLSPLLAGLMVFLALLSCGRVPEAADSNTKQLTNEDFPCYSFDNPSWQRTYGSLPAKFIDLQSFRVGSPRRVIHLLTGIPSAYRQWLFRVHNYNGFTISEKAQPEGIMGMTHFLGGIPTAVHIAAQAGAVDFAFQHEIGHAIHAKLRLDYPEFDREFQNIFQRDARHHAIRAYARSSYSEYFAEAFANHYCSRDSQDFLARELPDTYRFLRRYLEPAPWEPWAYQNAVR